MYTYCPSIGLELILRSLFATSIVIYYYTTNFLNCQGDIPLTINHRFARNLHSGYAAGITPFDIFHVPFLRGATFTEVSTFFHFDCLRIHFIPLCVW